MEFLCVINSLGSGGAQRQLVELAIGIKEKGHEVSFLVYHQENFFKTELDAANIIVNEIIEANYMLRLIKMRRFIRNGNFNSVLSFLEVPNFICEFSGIPFRKWKLVVGERSANPLIFKSFKLRMYRWFHLMADHIVANSKENVEMVRKINPLLSSKKCHVIYNIYNFEKWQPTIDNYEFKKDGKFHLIVIASHQYLKNLNGLIEAVNLLSIEEKAQLKIDWYGGSSLDNSKNDGQNKIKEFGLNKIFTFHKPTPKILETIQKADAVGLFSFYEGLPNVICESMLVGKPVVATKVSDIPLFILNTKLLSNPSEPKSICSSIRHLQQLSQDDLITEGFKNKTLAMETFNKEEIIIKYLKLLK